MDLKFLESVIIDHLIWVESYTVYVVWIHNKAFEMKGFRLVQEIFCQRFFTLEKAAARATTCDLECGGSNCSWNSMSEERSFICQSMLCAWIW